MLEDWGFSPYLITYLQQIYWECRRKGGALPPIQDAPPSWASITMGYSRKKTHGGRVERDGRGKGGIEYILFQKSPGIFRLFTLPLEIRDKKRLHSQKLHKIMLYPLEVLRPKTKTPGNSMLFLISQRKIHLLFLQYPWKFHILNPLFVFSGIVQYRCMNLPKTDDNDRAHGNCANILSLHIMVNASFWTRAS